MAKITKLIEEEKRVGSRLTARVKRGNKKYSKEIILKGGLNVRKITKKSKKAD